MLIIVLLVAVLVVSGCCCCTASGKKKASPTPEATIIPTPMVTPSPTPEPSPSPSPEPVVSEPGSSANFSDEYYADLQRYANDVILYGQSANKPASSIGLAGEDQTQVSPYPWVRYGYNDSQPYERRFMWTPEKWLSVANGEAERPVVYQRWLESVTPHHDVTVQLVPLDFDPDHDAIINRTMVGGTIILTNNQPGDPIARIDAEAKFYRYDPSAESYIEIPEYGFSIDHYTIGLLPGQSWPYTVKRYLEVRTGSYMLVVKIWNSDDGVLLAGVSEKGEVANDYGGGILSF